MININKYDTIGDLNDIVSEKIKEKYTDYIIRINYDVDKIEEYNLYSFLDWAICSADVIMKAIYCISSYKIVNIYDINILHISEV